METDKEKSIEMNNENPKSGSQSQRENKSSNLKQETQKNFSKTQKLNNNRYGNQQSKNYQTLRNPAHKTLPPINQSGDFSKGSFYLYASQTLPNQSQDTFNQTIKTEPKLNEEDLKEELTLLKLDLNRKTQELYELKIQFGKQLEENKSNKKLIENILNIDPNKPITKAEAIDKIEHAKPNEEEIKKLKEAYEAIELKAEIQKCKKEYIDTFNELDKIKKNAKTSIIRKLNNEITLKEENTRKINRTMKRMEKQINNNKEDIEKYKNQCEEMKKLSEEAKKNQEEEKKKEEE